MTKSLLVFYEAILKRMEDKPWASKEATFKLLGIDDPKVAAKVEKMTDAQLEKYFAVKKKKEAPRKPVLREFTEKHQLLLNRLKQEKKLTKCMVLGALRAEGQEELDLMVSLDQPSLISYLKGKAKRMVKRWEGQGDELTLYPSNSYERSLDEILSSGKNQQEIVGKVKEYQIEPFEIYRHLLRFIMRKALFRELVGEVEYDDPLYCSSKMEPIQTTRRHYLAYATVMAQWSFFGFHARDFEGHRCNILHVGFYEGNEGKFSVSSDCNADDPSDADLGKALIPYDWNGEDYVSFDWTFKRELLEEDMNTMSKERLQIVKHLLLEGHRFLMANGYCLGLSALFPNIDFPE